MNPTPQITRAMILAAGLGTRFKPWTDQHPKALAPVNGKSLLQRNVEYLQRYGIRDLIVNVHHFADQIIAAIRANNGWGSEISISDESDEVLETGGGLKKAAGWLGKGPAFLLMNVDILTDLDLFAMANDHFRHQPLATLAVSERVSSRYFLFNEDQELCGWRNTKTGEEKLSLHRASVPRASANRAPATGASATLIPKAFSGIHLIDPAIFPLMHRQGKFSMVDVYLDLASSQRIRGFDPGPYKLIDVGKPEAVAVAESLFP
ncbi:MAG: NTP transferase domain-containing protein [Bacteroidota bacterium]|nr:NTP transferase domain-containing protein [Bacteroidota bacterium]MDP4216278.1 NTP transferase domain-containing protein [Bacteroidota bacterium]MDP4244443.1 NTP transferase domain-containing protein [Bacteroidota bacterium]MDP4260348.1 NTP transferase domain-containing protein [Bacteroidota bacterium]